MEQPEVNHYITVLPKEVTVTGLRVDDITTPSLVEMLERDGGDLEKLTSRFTNIAAYTIYSIEKKLNEHDDITLKERWYKALDYFNRSKMLLIQRNAMRMLEHYDASSDNKGNTELAFCKLVLSDLFAANTTSARMRAGNMDDRNSVLDSVVEELQ